MQIAKERRQKDFVSVIVESAEDLLEVKDSHRQDLLNVVSS